MLKATLNGNSTNSNPVWYSFKWSMAFLDISVQTHYRINLGPRSTSYSEGLNTWRVTFSWRLLTLVAAKIIFDALASINSLKIFKDDHFNSWQGIRLFSKDSLKFWMVLPEFQNLGSITWNIECCTNICRICFIERCKENSSSSWSFLLFSLALALFFWHLFLSVWNTFKNAIQVVNFLELSASAV